MNALRSLAGAILAVVACIAVAEQNDTAVPARESAPVVIANRTIITLRGPIAGYSARERAAAAKRRIEEALESGEPANVSTADVADGSEVRIGSTLAFLVTRVDIDPQIGETTQNVAREGGKRLQRAIGEYREQHSPRYLLFAAMWTGVATAIYLGVLWLLFLLDRWAGRRVALSAASRAERVHVHGVSLLDPRQVRWLVRRLFVVLIWAVGLFATYSWISFVLKQFPYTRLWGEHMEGNLFELAGDIALAVLGAIPGLVVAVVILLLAWLVTRLANIFFDRIERGTVTIGGLDADTAVPTRRIFQIIVWAVAIALAYPYLPGAGTDAFKGVSVLFGLMVSIGAAGLVGQVASGLILMYTRAFRTGEYVKIGPTEGTIVGLGAFATRLRTGLGEEVLLPNSFALQNTTTNYSRTVGGTGFIVHTGVTIGYSTPWRQVHAMLEEAARRTPEIATDPPPVVRQIALSDFYVEYRLLAYSEIEHAVQRIEMMSRLHANIQDVFNEHGVQIMSPHYMTETSSPLVVPKAHWYASPAKPPENAGGEAPKR